MTVQRRISSYDWVPANDLIKVAAMVLMVIDHVGWAFSDQPALWRALGRGAFPLFAALLVAGMRRTRDPRRYLMRLTLFAVVSQYPFALCFKGLNIGFTLATGGLALYASENILEENRQTGHPWRGWLGWAAAMGAAGVVASLLDMDYGGMGILAMAVLQRSPTASVGIPLIMGWTVLFGWLRQWWVASCGAPVVGTALLLGWWLRDWKRRFLPRWIVYAFYPVHLAIIGLILTALAPGEQGKQPAPEPAAMVVRRHPRTDAPGREVHARGGRNSAAIPPTRNLQNDLIRATVPNPKWASTRTFFIPVATSIYGDLLGWLNPLFSSDLCNIAGIRGRRIDGRSVKFDV